VTTSNTRGIVSIVLAVGLVLLLLILAATDADQRLTFMLAGGLLSALSAAIGYLFHDATGRSRRSDKRR
jgi:glycerol uptake facilitator-like aquaporin